MKNEILSLKETNLKLEEQVKNLNEENENNKQKLSKYESNDDNISKEDLINKNKSLEEENKKLNQKLSNLKQSVLQLNERLEKDIYGKTRFLFIKHEVYNINGGEKYENCNCF